VTNPASDLNLQPL
jgi:hypothetical protein